MEIADSVNVVNVEGLEAILPERADKIAGVDTDDLRMTYVKTRYKAIAIQLVEVTNELLGS